MQAQIINYFGSPVVLLQPLLDTRVFNFSEVAQIHQWVESGQALGKVVCQQG